MACEARVGSLDWCCLALPKDTCKALGLEANLDDLGQPKELWFGPLWQLNQLLDAGGGEAKRSRTDLAAQGAPGLGVLERLSGHARGVVVTVHGSGGISAADFRYVRMLATLGMVVVAPDSMLMSRRRRRETALPLAPSSEIDYWSRAALYKTEAAGDLAYSTKSENVCDNPAYYKLLYESVYWERFGELALVMKSLPASVRESGVFLIGNSEGAMVVNRFDEREHGVRVLGRMVSAFSMEYCYFTPTKEAAMLGGSCDVPLLQWIGTEDPYFGGKDSVATRVVAHPAGYGDPELTGNGYKTICARGARNALVCLLEHAPHDNTLQYDSLLRTLLDAFIADPSSCGSLAGKLDKCAFAIVESAQDEGRTFLRVDRCAGAESRM